MAFTLAPWWCAGSGSYSHRTPAVLSPKQGFRLVLVERVEEQARGDLGEEVRRLRRHARPARRHGLDLLDCSRTHEEAGVVLTPLEQRPRVGRIAGVAEAVEARYVLVTHAQGALQQQ